jgi:hypothetical protein
MKMRGQKFTFSSVAEPELEPEPVEQQLFAGAGARAKDKFL